MTKETLPRLSSGISGLDEILYGGFPSHRACLIRGGPGTGKTTLGLHFLAAGVAAGEAVLCITLEESASRLRQDAAALGLTLPEEVFVDLSPEAGLFSDNRAYDLFTPAEVEGQPMANRVLERLTATKPHRVFLDPMTQLRYLYPDAFHFRQQVLSLLRLITSQDATLLFTSEPSREFPDDDLQFLADGVVELTLGEADRSIAVTKLRGSDFVAGPHVMRITARGIEVFPRLVPAARIPFEHTLVPSGVPDLDRLLGGGLEQGTIAIITGPTGVGKTTLGLQFANAAAARGHRSVIYSFEEEVEIMLARCDGVGIPARRLREQGLLDLVKVEPLLHAPDEFVRLVRDEIQQNKTQAVMIDSTAGYELAMRGRNVTAHLHALARFLQNKGLLVLLVTETRGVLGELKVSELNLSYLGDTVVFLRYLEMQGRLCKAIGVLKKRLGDFEKTLREFEITSRGIRVGPPLTGLRGILSGHPMIDEASP